MSRGPRWRAGRSSGPWWVQGCNSCHMRQSRRPGGSGGGSIRTRPSCRLETGHDRDYREGAAYRDYFSNDKLYFSVPRLDRRLKNKAEVVVFTIPTTAGGTASERQAVAISADFLERNPVYEFERDTLRYVIVDRAEGANEVYDARGVAPRFVSEPTPGRPGDRCDGGA